MSAKYSGMYCRSWLELSLWYMECGMYIGWIMHGMFGSFENLCQAHSSIFRSSDLWASIAGWSFVSDSWEFRAPCHDGEGTWSITTAYVEESWVSDLPWELTFSWLIFKHNKIIDSTLLCMFSRHADKYVRRGRLDWPEGAASRESIKAVMKLPRLQVYILTICFLTSLCKAIHSQFWIYSLLFSQIFAEPSNAACWSLSRWSHPSVAGVT